MPFIFGFFSGKNFETNHDVNLNKVNAIVDDHAFKTTAMLLFKKTMLLLTNIANENPELLKNIPEFLCQNINDVTGLLSRYSLIFVEDSVSTEFINVTLDYAVLFMASPKCAFNPHLRKDIGPLLSACCPFDKRRAQDGGRGAAITTSGQVRHMTLADYKNKKGLLASIIGVFCDCEYITDDDGFDSKLNFRLPFYTLLGTVFISVKSKLDGSEV